jgi:hypothetical protein
MTSYTLPSTTELVSHRIEDLLRTKMGCSGDWCWPCSHGWVSEVAKHLAEYLDQPPMLLFGLTLAELQERIMYWDSTHAKPARIK